MLLSTHCTQDEYCGSAPPPPIEEKTDVDCVCSPRKYAVTTNDYKGIDPVAETCSINAVNLQGLCKTNPLEIDGGVPGIKTTTELVTLPVTGRSAMCNVCTRELGTTLDGNCDDIAEDEFALSIIVSLSLSLLFTYHMTYEILNVPTLLIRIYESSPFSL